MASLKSENVTGLVLADVLLDGCVGLTAADGHLLEIWHAASRLLENPELDKARDELIHGLRSIPVYPHIVFYRTSIAAIEIVRVLHQQEDVENFFG